MHDPHYSERSDVENEVGLLYSSAYVEGAVDYRGEEERWKEAEGREEMKDWMWHPLSVPRSTRARRCGFTTISNKPKLQNAGRKTERE